MHPERAIGFEVRTLSNLIKRQFDKSGHRPPKDKQTAMQGWVIGYLYGHRDADIFQRDLELEFSIRRSTATGILQLMEKNGLLTRTPVPQDARLKKLTLTEKAVGIHQGFMNHVENLESLMSKGLTDEELDAFFSIVAKIKKNLE